MYKYIVGLLFLFLLQMGCTNAISEKTQEDIQENIFESVPTGLWVELSSTTSNKHLTLQVATDSTPNFLYPLLWIDSTSKVDHSIHLFYDDFSSSLVTKITNSQGKINIVLDNLPHEVQYNQQNENLLLINEQRDTILYKRLLHRTIGLPTVFQDWDTLVSHSFWKIPIDSNYTRTYVFGDSPEFRKKVTDDLESLSFYQIPFPIHGSSRLLNHTNSSIMHDTARLKHTGGATFLMENTLVILNSDEIGKNKTLVVERIDSNRIDLIDVFDGYHKISMYRDSVMTKADSTVLLKEWLFL